MQSALRCWILASRNQPAYSRTQSGFPLSMQLGFRHFIRVPKPGIEQVTKLEEFTATPNANGPYALIEFTGALPRARLYSHWQVSTNDQATLQTLTNADFDPQQTVLVSTPLPGSSPTNQNPRTVEFTSYAPNHIVFSPGRRAIRAAAQRYVRFALARVGGRQAGGIVALQLYHARRVSGARRAHGGIQVQPAEQIALRHPGAIGVGLLLCGFLIVAARRPAGPLAQP